MQILNCYANMSELPDELQLAVGQTHWIWINLFLASIQVVFICVIYLAIL